MITPEELPALFAQLDDLAPVPGSEVTLAGVMERRAALRRLDRFIGVTVMGDRLSRTPNGLMWLSLDGTEYTNPDGAPRRYSDAPDACHALVSRLRELGFLVTLRLMHDGAVAELRYYHVPDGDWKRAIGPVQLVQDLGATFAESLARAATCCRKVISENPPPATK